MTTTTFPSDPTPELRRGIARYQATCEARAEYKRSSTPRSPLADALARRVLGGALPGNLRLAARGPEAMLFPHRQMSVREWQRGEGVR